MVFIYHIVSQIPKSIIHDTHEPIEILWLVNSNHVHVHYNKKLKFMNQFNSESCTRISRVHSISSNQDI